MLNDSNEYTSIADTLKQTIITRHAESEERVCTLGGRKEYPEVGGKRKCLNARLNFIEYARLQADPRLQEGLLSVRIHGRIHWWEWRPFRRIRT